MKVGEYARTKWGCIAKFEGINESFYEFDNIIMDESSAVREELFADIVEKSSPNIIDLIEVGDYVNGYLVKDIDYAFDDVVMNNKDARIVPYIDCNKDKYIDDIKSIVTKEQFESMKYRIGE